MSHDYHGWLPANPAVRDAFFDEILGQAEILKSQPKATYGLLSYQKLGHDTTQPTYSPAVEAFKEAIEADEEMVKLFEKIFLEVDPQNKVKDFEQLLRCLDVIIAEPPKYVVAKDQGEEVKEPIGVPIYLLFDLLSNTNAAYELFRKPKFNMAMKQLLDSWGRYLTTGDSAKTLNEGPQGWFNEASLADLEEKAGGKFNDVFVVADEDAPNRGYDSWDEFFTRKVRRKSRPIIQKPGRSDIYNACESTFVRYTRNVKAYDKFWLKGMPYSLYDIFGGDKTLVHHFVGGTIYQAFLSPQDYHRWHSPVAGRVEVAYVIPGTYYAVLPDEGVKGDAHGAMVRCQPWLSMSAARAVIIIHADNPSIGRVCVVPIGMVEVSTCQLLVERGQRVKAGDQIGMFHFGGSSHAVIFGRNVNLEFDPRLEEYQNEGKDKGEKPPHIHVNEAIAHLV